MDFMATFLDLAGITYPQEFQGRRPVAMEGRSLVPIFRGENREPHPVLAWNCSRGRAIRMGDWKLVKTKEGQNLNCELYNLKEDGGETLNLATGDPDRVRAMSAAYDAWKVRVGAQ